MKRGESEGKELEVFLSLSLSLSLRFGREKMKGVRKERKMNGCESSCQVLYGEDITLGRMTTTSNGAILKGHFMLLSLLDRTSSDEAKSRVTPIP